MPIRPEMKVLYPKNWKVIRSVILARAENKCERCGVENYSVGAWYRDKWITQPYWNKDTVGDIIYHKPVALPRKSEIMIGKARRIVLTIAHLNHDPTDNRQENLAALCQRCHNRHDIADRVRGRRKRLHAARAIGELL